MIRPLSNLYFSEILIIYVRYRQIKDICSKTAFKPHVINLNKASAILGTIASFGLGIVGDFQETNVLVVHLIGASLSFGLGSIYLCLQV